MLCLSKFFSYTVLQAIHTTDLETHFSTDSQVRFKGSLARVKIDHSP